MPSEHTEQVKLVTRLRHLHECLVMAIPNGGKRDRKEAGRLKAEGVYAGAPDLLVAFPGRPGRILFIEMKTLTGRLSKAQQDVHRMLKQLGFDVIVGYGCEDAYNKFKEWAYV